MAQSSEVRSTSLPEVPTLQEEGFSGLVIEAWFGALVPVATPPGIVARLNIEMDKAVADAATRQSLLEAGTEPVGGSADQFAHIIRQDSEKYERLAKELRIKAE